MAQNVTLPPAGGQYDSQLGGAYDPPSGTLIVSRDRAEPPAPGLYNICYINAFQTQPQETSWWVTNHPDLLLRQHGALAEDPNWPGEVLLDTGTEEKRAALAAIVAGWIAQCARDGYQAIEADNLDTYSRSANALSIADNLAYATLLIDHAHRLGLAFGQKNDGELGGRGKAAGFDFASSSRVRSMPNATSMWGSSARMYWRLNIPIPTLFISKPPARHAGAKSP